jgi:hypothetical protein
MGISRLVLNNSWTLFFVNVLENRTVSGGADGGTARGLDCLDGRNEI